ncbi:MAG TPA: hypothetical protein VD766_10005 [Solirubrobacterales bacterium]|nr:hypothetical protein [Solirubrobacterales bacterium]
MASFEDLTAERFIEALHEAEIDALVGLFADDACLEDGAADSSAAAAD